METPIVIALIGLLKALIWPVAIYFIIKMTRVDIPRIITDLAARVTKASATGVEFDPPKQQAADTTALAATNQTGDAPSASNLGPWQLTIRSTYASFLKPEDNALAREGKLLDMLAVAGTEALNERLYRSIYGSQIRLLKQLNTVNIATREHVKEFLRADGLANGWSPELADQIFEEWLGYLVHTGCVADTGGQVTILPRGRDFLVYMVNARLSEDRIG